MANPFWRNESLETYLDRWATERPDKTAIVDGRGRYTYAQVARDVERIAHGLLGLSIEQGLASRGEPPRPTARTAAASVP